MIPLLEASVVVSAIVSALGSALLASSLVRMAWIRDAERGKTAREKPSALEQGRGAAVTKDAASDDIFIWSISS